MVITHVELSVKALFLQAYMPETYRTPADVAQLGTMICAYIPKAQVNTLASEIENKSSKLYTGSTGIAQQLAQHISSEFGLETVVDPNAGTNGSTGTGSSSSSKKKHNIIIGVVSALGAIALIILALLIYRFHQRRQKLGHERPDLYAASHAEGGEFD